LTHEEFMTELTRQGYIWRMAVSRNRDGRTERQRASLDKTAAAAVRAIDNAVVERAATIAADELEEARLRDG
jgi:hypothetical protein